MSRLVAPVVRLNKQKIVTAVVHDVLGNLCSVRLSGRGPVLHSLKYSGPAPTKGSTVIVDYRSGTPIVITNSESLEKSLDDLRTEMLAIQAEQAIASSSPPPEEISSAKVESINDIGDVDVEGVTDGQVLTYDEPSGLWIASDPTGGGGGGSGVIDDLSSQIPATGDHFDFVDEADGDVMLFFNGVLQPAAAFTVDVDGMGVTTEFSPVAGDTLIAIYGPPALGSPTGWDLVMDEDGTTFANFTSASGTWSSDGTIIKQTATDAVVRRARHNTKHAIAGFVMEMDVLVHSSSGGDSQVGPVVFFDGTNGGGISVAFRASDDDVRVDVDAVAAVATYALTVDIDTWYALRIVVSGFAVSVYVDDVLLGTARAAISNGDASYVGLRTYKAEGHFRNIKLWTSKLP